MFKKLLVFLLLPTTFVLASGFSIYEQSARATGMAGAFTAHADDPSAIFYNPAGISQLKGWNVLLGSTMIHTQFSFTGPASMDSRAYTKAQPGTFFPSHLYVTYGFSERLAFGLGIYTPFGLGTEWGSAQQPWVGRLLATKTALQTIAVNPVVSVRVFKNLSVAVGASLVKGNVSLEKDIYFAPRNLYGHSKLEASTSAFGFNVGLRWNFLEKFHFGVQYRSSLKLDFNDGNAYFTFPQTTDAQVNAEIQALFPQKTTGRSQLTLPVIWSAGIGFDATENLKFEVDYLFQGWHTYDRLTVNFDQPVGGSTVSESPRNYQDAYSLRFGLEYRMEEGVIVRAGYAWDKRVVPSAYVEPGFPENHRHNYTVGLGYKFKGFTIDAAYHLLLQDDRKIENSVHTFNGKYTGLANLYGLSVGYSF